MHAHIQYSLADCTWSAWSLGYFEQDRWLVDGQPVETDCVRVLKNADKEQPLVCWHVFHDGLWYEIAPSKTGHIAKAMPLKKHILPLAIERLPGDFSAIAFSEMLDSAKEYLAPLLFSAEDMASRLLRPTDPTQVMALTAATTATEAMKAWWGDLYRQYYEDIHGQLMTIVERRLTRAQQIAALVAFFKNHYAFIQGSCLDYLAIPEHPVTLMLIEVAQVLATALHCPLIDVLMPGVAIDHDVNGVSLADLPIKQVLHTHLYLTSGFLMPISILNQYLDDPVSPLYCPYGRYHEDSKSFEYQRLNAQDIEALFNHSAETQALKDAFQTTESLKNQTEHLLGQLHLLIKKLKLYDAHGGFGTQENAAGGAYSAIINFMQYYWSLEPCQLLIQDRPPVLEDVPVEQKLAYVYDQEQLYFINGYTQTITPLTTTEQKAKSPVFLARFGSLHDIPQDLNTPCIVQTDDGQYTLFPQQAALNRAVIDEIALNFPSKKQRVIQLAASNLSAHVFQALLDAGFTAPRWGEVFSARFSQSQPLSREDLAWISSQTGHSFLSGYALVPAPVRTEIELLWQLLHNPTMNQDATTNMATCIGSRGEALQARAVEYEVQLIAIGPYPQQQQKLLAEAQSRLDCLREAFNQALHAKVYQGHDRHLSLTAALMRRYQKIITIRSAQDLYALPLFNPQDLQLLLEQQQLVIAFEGEADEDFVLYLAETPAAILKVMLPELFKVLAMDAWLWPAILELIGLEKERIIFGIFSGLLQTPRACISLLNYLPPEQGSRFCAVMKEHWVRIIATEADFSEIMEQVTAEQRDVVYEAIKEHWVRIIVTGADFNKIMKPLTAEQQDAVYEAMKDHWLAIIKNGEDFSQVLEYLTLEQRDAVYEAMKDRGFQIIKNGKDFSQVMKYLTAAQGSVVYESIKNDWRQLITDGNDFAAVCEYFDQEQTEAAYASMKTEDWRQIINSGDDLAFVFGAITLEQGSVLCESIKDHLLAMIGSKEALVDFFTLLRGQRWEVAYRAIQSAVPAVIQNGDDVRFVLRTFKPEQGRLICVSLEDHWSRIIENHGSLTELLFYIQNEQFDTVCVSIKKTFPTLVQDCRQLNELLFRLPEDRCRRLCEIMKEHWPHFISKGRDYTALKQGLAGKKEIVFSAMQEHLLTILKTADDFRRVFDGLPEEQSSVFFAAMQGRWALIINTEEDLWALNCLSPAQCKIVFEEIKAKWSAICKDPEDLHYLMANQPQNKKAIQTALVSEQLLQYTRRIERQVKNGAPDFEYGFWFFKKSRAVNRKINYLLAVQLVTELQLQAENFNFTMFSRINEIRANILKNLSVEDKKHYVDRGINSNELNEIMKWVKLSC